MADLSNEVRNYFKLQLLIDHSGIRLRSLFKSRYSLFNGGTSWVDSSACGNNYLKTIPKKDFKGLTPLQKTPVLEGNTNKWDAATLITLLLLCTKRPSTLSANETQQLDEEDKYLKKLQEIRNKIAHHPTKLINDIDFNELWTELTTILIVFGDQIFELDKFKDDSIFDSSKEFINEDNVKKALRLNSLGTQAYKDKKYFEAIEFFTQVTHIENISRQHQAAAYTNMAASRLLLYEQQQNPSNSFEFISTTDERYRALGDADKAKDLCLTWWKGHFRVGQVYASLNEHEQAIDSLEQALILDPTKTEIQKALDNSRQILSQQMRHDHLDPRFAPITIPEHLQEMKELFDIDPKLVRQTHSLNEIYYPSGADVIKGHKYEHGDIDTEQNYEQAAKYFAKAASQGNAEGMYNLARLTDRGLGVKKDHNRALELLEQAAGQSPEDPQFKGRPNVGVAEAEHSLGLRYYEGISVQKNPGTAAYWFQRGVVHGCAASANNLGLMYLDGTGIRQDCEKAEQLLKLAARRGDPNAMLILAERFLEKNDLEMAKLMHERACRAQHAMAKMGQDSFLKRLKAKQEFISKCSPKDLRAINAVENLNEIFKNKKTPSTQGSVVYASYYETFCERANQGSITAQHMCKAVEYFYQALMILTKNESLTKEQENLFVHELSQCYRIEHIVAQFSGLNMDRRVEEIVNRVLGRCVKQSNSVTSQLDEDVRVCYATLNMHSYEKAVQFLHSCKQKYPKSIYFFLLSGAMNGFLHRLNDALYDFNSGLVIESNNIELLYNRAVILRQLGQDNNEAIAAYEKFLSLAPKDHRKVPEAYYAMGICHFQRDGPVALTDSVKKFYMKGKEAEQLQLPCFIPCKSGSLPYITTLIDMVQLNESLTTTTTPVKNHKLRLTDPYRIEIITEHRKWDNQKLQWINNPDLINITNTQPPRSYQSAPKSLVGLKPITIREMDPRLDQIYTGYVLSVTIIEDIHLWTPSIHLVVEDENLDCERVHIYGFSKNEGSYLTNEVYTIGSKMHIMNPYIRIGSQDQKAYIRVDDLTSISMEDETERIKNMCQCCGQPNAPHVCSKCTRARYCSKECQTMDWNVYKHQLICQIK